MRSSIARVLVVASYLSCGGFAPLAAEIREAVILSTNDFHSAIDPIPAYWLEGDPPPHLGGAANLMTLVEQIREREAENGVPVFLFDSGDMFTGMLAKLTKGEALMEMMATMDYDALGIGNHFTRGEWLDEIEVDVAMAIIEYLRIRDTPVSAAVDGKARPGFRRRVSLLTTTTLVRPARVEPKD